MHTTITASFETPFCREPELPALLLFLSRTTGFFVDGEEVETWADPDRPFGLESDVVSAYVDNHQWEVLFNAIFAAASLLNGDAGVAKAS